MELAFPALVSLRVGQGLCHICEAKRRKCDCSCKLKLCRNFALCFDLLCLYIPEPKPKVINCLLFSHDF